MHTTETRVQLVKAKIIQGEKRQRTRTIYALCAASTALLTALALAIGLYGGAGHTLQDTQMTGSSLLSESAGAYVLVAVIAFCLGSIACLVRRPGK